VLATVIVAVRKPVSVGLNATLSAQLVLGATLPTHDELVIGNSVGSLLVTLLIVTGVPPVFVTSACTDALGEPTFWLPKSTEGGICSCPGAGPTDAPVPLTSNVCGLPAPLLVMVNAELRAPVADGLKMMLILQLPPTGTGAVVQVWLTIVNSVPLPLLIDVTVTLAVPTLGIVTAVEPLWLPTFWLPRLTELGT
jgi:hypothetical protein